MFFADNTDSEGEAHRLAALMKEKQQVRGPLGFSGWIKFLNRSSRRMRLAIKGYLETSTFGLVMDIFNVVLSLIACCMYVYDTYVPQDGTGPLASVEIILVSWFMYDYILKIYISDNRFETITSGEGIVDFLSILPVFFEENSSMTVITSKDIDLSILGFMRVMKIFRLLRLRRLLEYFQDEVTKEIFVMSLTFMFIIFFGAGMFHFVENLPDSVCIRFLDATDDDTYSSVDLRQDCEDTIGDLFDDDEEYFTFTTNSTGDLWNQKKLLRFQLMFHEAAYFVVVTMTTVGYGDIGPTSGVSQMVTSVLILTTVIFVPFQTNQLLKVISEQSVWGKQSYNGRKNHRHVLVAGTVNSNGLACFIHEFYNADQLRRSDDVMNVVIMAPSYPSNDVIDLLADPAFASRLTYISGSVLAEKDLLRADVGRAEAVWLLSNKLTDRPDEEDALTILRSLQLRAYFNLRPEMQNTKLFTQLIQPENRTKLHMSSSMDGVSEQEAILCIDEMKMHIIARSCITPGIFTILNNLVTSSSGLTDSQLKGDNQRDSRGKKLMPWEAEYLNGVQHEIYRVKLAPSFDGLQFFEVNAAVYQAFGCVLMAVEQDGNMFIAPGELKLSCRDTRNPTYAYVITENSVQANQLEHFKEGQTFKGEHMGHDVETKEGDDSRTSGRPSRKSGGTFVVKHQESFKASDKRIVDKLSEEYVICNERRPYADGSIWCTDDLLPEGCSWDDIVEENRHIVICGNVPDLYHFILPLRSRSSLKNGRLPTIVVLHPVDMQVSDWHRLSIFPQVYFIKGSPLYKEDLLRAGVPQARQVIVFSPIKKSMPLQIGANNITQMEQEAMADADTLFINSALHSINPNVHIISELVHFSNMPYLNAIHEKNTDSSPNPSVPSSEPTSPTSPGMTRLSTHGTSVKGLETGAGVMENEGGGISPWFAAGNVYVSSLNDFLSAQLFHNPKLVSLLEKIIVSGEQRDSAGRKMDSTMIDLVCPYDLSRDGFKKREGKFKAKTMLWHECYFAFQRLKAIPIALLRMPASSDDPDGIDFGNQMQYVYTNPPRDTLVRTHDKVFLLLTTKVSWVINKGTKLRVFHNKKQRESGGSGGGGGGGGNGSGTGNGMGNGVRANGDDTPKAEPSETPEIRRHRRLSVNVLDRGGVRLDEAGNVIKAAAGSSSTTNELEELTAKLKNVLAATSKLKSEPNTPTIADAPASAEGAA